MLEVSCKNPNMRRVPWTREVAVADSECILNAEPILFADGLEVEYEKYEKGGKDENKVLVWQDRIVS